MQCGACSRCKCQSAKNTYSLTARQQQTVLLVFNIVNCVCMVQIGIANRDIKLENTLLMDESERPLLKLCDFGYSKDEYQGSACKTLCGKTSSFASLQFCAQACHQCISHCHFTVLAQHRDSMQQAPLGLFSYCQAL